MKSPRPASRASIAPRYVFDIVAGMSIALASARRTRGSRVIGSWVLKMIAPTAFIGVRVTRSPGISRSTG